MMMSNEIKMSFIYRIASKVACRIQILVAIGSCHVSNIQMWTFNKRISIATHTLSPILCVLPRISSAN